MLCINNALKIIGPYIYMAAIDLTDAFFFYTYTFYSSKYLKFTFYHLFQLFHAYQMDMTCYKSLY